MAAKQLWIPRRTMNAIVNNSSKLFKLVSITPTDIKFDEFTRHHMVIEDVKTHARYNVSVDLDHNNHIDRGWSEYDAYLEGDW